MRRFPIVVALGALIGAGVGIAARVAFSLTLGVGYSERELKLQREGKPLPEPRSDDPDYDPPSQRARRSALWDLPAYPPWMAVCAVLGLGFGGYFYFESLREQRAKEAAKSRPTP